MHPFTNHRRLSSRAWDMLPSQEGARGGDRSQAPLIVIGSSEGSRSRSVDVELLLATSLLGAIKSMSTTSGADLELHKVVMAMKELDAEPAAWPRLKKTGPMVAASILSSLPLHPCGCGSGEAPPVKICFRHLCRAPSVLLHRAPPP